MNLVERLNEQGSPIVTDSPKDVRFSRILQIAAWFAALAFVLGWFTPIVGACTGTILGAWFVRTQKPLRGFLWMMAFSLFGRLLWTWRLDPLADPTRAAKLLAAMILAAVCAVLPFTFYRLISPHLPGLVSTFPLPLAALAILPLVQQFHFDNDAPAASQLLFFWLAAIVVWMWRCEFRPLATGSAFFAALGLSLLVHFAGFATAIPIGNAIAWACLAALLALSVWALAIPSKALPWSQRSVSIARLRSPYTTDPLTATVEQGGEQLVSASGERFAIRQGIPVFLRPQDLTGDNGKYHGLYETIGGFYDDVQRVFCALKGFDRDSYFLSYMRLLDVKPGDEILETSVGTGLNFQYLPRETKLTGLDFSPEMLANCAANLRRWKISADLILGNAEHLPFADSSFDVVFHVGGINFFTDRAGAIREMIRVCKPGGQLLIADETEKHVKEVYEKMPGNLYRGRKEEVSAPIDLVPAEMEGIRVALLKEGSLYAITFRKPAPPTPANR
jgi:ubiquinone/menaquinone biosynthesis C-methylase UbiE